MAPASGEVEWWCREGLWVPQEECQVEVVMMVWIGFKCQMDTLSPSLPLHQMLSLPLQLGCHVTKAG